MTERRVEDSELHALVDGELDAARQAEVEAWLSDNPEAARRVARYRAQNAGLHALFDGVLSEDIPPATIAALAGRRRQWLPRSAAIAAGVALLIAGGAAGWLARGAMAPTSDGAAQITAQAQPPIDTQELMVRAAMAHTVSSDEDLRMAAADGGEDTGRYISTRMGERVRVPQLESLGYRLIGSRVLPDTGGPAAQFVFEDREHMRVSLYVRSEKAKGVDVTYALADDLSMFYWNDSKHSYALVRDVEDQAGRDNLLTAAKMVHQQITE